MAKTLKARTEQRAERLRTAVRARMTALDHDTQTTAAGAGMHRSTLGRWLTGTREMTVAQLLSTLEYLDIPETALCPHPAANSRKRK